MRYLNVGSGSSGNSTIIYTADTTIIIDCGVSKKRIVDCLHTIGKDLTDVDALLITHRHEDHTKYLKALAPVLAARTYSGDDFNIEEDYRKSNTLLPFQRLTIRGLEITALPISHDVPNSMGYLLKEMKTGTRLMYMTDTGYIPFKDLGYCKDCEYYLLESNHDPEMLMRSDRNNWLKMRIIGDRGHLSNEQSAHYLTMIVGPHTKEIALAHLSRDCNTPQIATKTFHDVFLAQFGQVPPVILKTLDAKTPTSGGDTINR